MSRQPEPEAEGPQVRVKQRRKKIGAVSAPTAGYNQRVSKPHKIVLNKSPSDQQQRKARVVAKPYKKRYKIVLPKSNLDRQYHAARVVPAAAVTHEVPAHGEYSRDHGNRKEHASSASLSTAVHIFGHINNWQAWRTASVRASYESR